MYFSIQKNLCLDDDVHPHAQNILFCLIGVERIKETEEGIVL